MRLRTGHPRAKALREVLPTVDLLDGFNKDARTGGRRAVLGHKHGRDVAHPANGVGQHAENGEVVRVSGARAAGFGAPDDHVLGRLADDTELEGDGSVGVRGKGSAIGWNSICAREPGVGFVDSSWDCIQ